MGQYLEGHRPKPQRVLILLVGACTEPFRLYVRSLAPAPLRLYIVMSKIFVFRVSCFQLETRNLQLETTAHNFPHNVLAVSTTDCGVGTV